MSTIKPGDIIFADRTVYKHYGVYVDKNTVIHYATDDGSLDPLAKSAIKLAVDKAKPDLIVLILPSGKVR